MFLKTVANFLDSKSLISLITNKHIPIHNVTNSNVI